MKIFKILLISTLFLSAGDIDRINDRELEVKEVFDLYDSDDNGKLDIAEFVIYANKGIERCMTDEVNSLISACDNNINGILEKNDIMTTDKITLKVLNQYRHFTGSFKDTVKVVCAKYADSFTEIDTNHDDKLDKDELLIFVLKDKYWIHNEDYLAKSISKKLARKNEKRKNEKFNIVSKKKSSKLSMMYKIALFCNKDDNDYIDKKEATECDVPDDLFNSLDADKNIILGSRLV